jgi:uncharacterized protein
MPDKSKEREDLFIIRRDIDKNYLYAPLRRLVASVNDAAADVVARYNVDELVILGKNEKEIIDNLKEHGLWQKPYPKPPLFPDSYNFCPHEVTLFPTSDCNLQCRYCYANAGHKHVKMQWEVAQAAIDEVAKNAGLLGADKFIIGFHGGGEPMMAWDFIVKATGYASQKGQEMGLNVEFHAATNGLYSPAQREFLVDHFTTLTISLDGPKDIQDFNRPQKNGTGSYDIIAETLRYFDSREFFYGIRSTVTAGTVSRMKEIVETLKSEFNIAYLHFEPVWSCGRCVVSGEQPPQDSEFIKHFQEAKNKGKALGIEVTYSGARLDSLTSKYCAAPGDGFSVLPEGIATSCYEVLDATEPKAEIFHFGKYNSEKKCFDFDLERIKNLKTLSVENLNYCSDCFCKWHCAGDCLSKVFDLSGSREHKGSIRCNLNRQLTIADMDTLIEEQ